MQYRSHPAIVDSTLVAHWQKRGIIRALAEPTEALKGVFDIQAFDIVRLNVYPGAECDRLAIHRRADQTLNPVNGLNP